VGKKAIKNVAIGERCKIHRTVDFGDNISIGDDVTIEQGVLLKDNVTIESSSYVGPRTIIGAPTRDFFKKPEDYQNQKTIIRKSSIIRANCIIYCGNEFGPNLETGDNVLIRENNMVGKNVRIGTLCDIQGRVSIGDFCRFHSNVHIGQKSIIGNRVWIFPYVVLTNDTHAPCGKCLKGPVIEDFVIIGTKAVVLPNLTISEGAVIGALSLVTKNVPAGMLMIGVPGKVVFPAKEIKCKTGLLKEGNPYPWQELPHLIEQEGIGRS